MTSQNNYLIISPIRTASTWLNTVFAEHYKLNNIAEKISKMNTVPDGYAFSRINEWTKKHGINNKVYNGPDGVEYGHNRGSDLSNDYVKLRSLDRDGQIKYVKDQGPSVIKFKTWDLYEDKNREYPEGWGFNLDKLKKEWAPLTTIFLYRKNIPEHFLSLLSYHRTGITNAVEPNMKYDRPKDLWDAEWKKYYDKQYLKMIECYNDHKFDHTVAYEDLFEMDELCGIPLKQYHNKFTFKLNKYTREEKDEVIRQTGYSENYELH